MSDFFLGIVDLFMAIIFLTPFLRIIIFGESGQFHTPQYEWSTRLIGSLGATLHGQYYYSGLQKSLLKKKMYCYLLYFH